MLALRARDAVDRGLGDQIAVERDRAAGVVIARHHEGDAVGIAVGVDDGGDRNVEPPRLLDRDVFLVGVDHEQQVGQAAHVLDAAERAVELVALALQRRGALSWCSRWPRSEASISSSLRSREIDCEMVFQLVERAAEPARIDVVLRASASAASAIGVLRLPLGADEQDAAALGDGVAHRLQRAMQHRHGLGEIDDVDVVAGAEDVLAPSSDSSGGPDGRSARQLPAADAWRKSGTAIISSRLIRRETGEPCISRHRTAFGPLSGARKPRSACEMAWI